MAMHDEKYKLREELDMKKDSHLIKEMEELMKKKKKEEY